MSTSRIKAYENFTLLIANFAHYCSSTSRIKASENFTLRVFNFSHYCSNCKETPASADAIKVNERW